MKTQNSLREELTLWLNDQVIYYLLKDNILGTIFEVADELGSHYFSPAFVPADLPRLQEQLPKGEYRYAISNGLQTYQASFWVR